MKNLNQEFKYSIILPCYNVEKYLAKSLDSVLNQTFSNFELLVVIDGSLDASQQIAEEYALKDRRVRVLIKENGGLSDARNYGLERAKGEFIYFMDSDDWIEPTLLEENLKIIEGENLDFVAFGYIQDNEDALGNVVKTSEILPKVSYWEKGDLDIIIDGHHLGLLGYAWNKVYRKSFLDQHNFRFQKGISLVEDILFNAPIYKQSTKIRFNQKGYYHYLNRPVSTLMKSFHPEHLTWKKKKDTALSTFMEEWKIKNRNTILANNYINGFRESIHSLFAYENQLSESNKRDYIDLMYNDELTLKRILHFQKNSLKDRMYYLLVKNKYVFLTWIFAKLIK